MIIDFHTHCFPDELAGKALPLLAEHANVEPYSDGTVSGLKQSMARAGITLSVIQHIATKPAQTEVINTWAAEIQDEQIACFGTIHPDFPEWKEEIIRIRKLGFKGVKFHPDYQDFFIDEERVFPIYDTIFANDLIVLFHAGVDIGLPPPYHCTPKRLVKVMQAFPGGKIVAAHMGSYQYWEEVEQHLLGRDIFFDTSYSFQDLGRDRMSFLIKSHGADKILFATDSPWTDQQSEVEAIRSLELTEREKELILGENAAKLLGITR